MPDQPIGPIEALKIAMRLEVEAAEFYKMHAAKPSAAQEIFQFLVNEEVKHQQLIEKKIAELTKI